MRHHSLSHVRHSAVLLVIAAYATPAVAQDLETRKRVAGDAYIACLHTAAAKLDDRVSDASGVGLGVAGACARERETFAIVSGRGVMDLERIMRQKLEGEAHSRATSIVLAERALRRAR